MGKAIWEIAQWAFRQFRLTDLLDPVLRSDFKDTLTDFTVYNFAFGFMTECEAEIMSNVEAHLMIYQDPNIQYSDTGMPYPPLTEEDYLPFHIAIREHITQKGEVKP